jgi:hypothetical protein
MVELGNTALPAALRIDSRDAALAARLEFPRHKHALVTAALSDVSFEHDSEMIE